MMRNRRFSKFLPMTAMAVGLAACDGGVGTRLSNLDLDLRGTAGGLDTSNAARQASQNRPQPDATGVISYPTYQVAVAQRGDTVTSVAQRVGVEASTLARFNGLKVDDRLNAGEVLALSTAPATPSTGTAPAPLDVTSIATSAIDSAPQATGGIARAEPSRRIDGPEPVQHQVSRGETAFSIARLYNVSVRALSDWNGLGPDLEVREGQYLLIPVSKVVSRPQPGVDVDLETGAKTTAIAVTTPGTGTATPQPPSATQPLPDEQVAALKKKEEAPAAVVETKTASRMVPPVTGKVLRPYKKRKNDGIDIAASAGTAVKAAADGEVAAITRDTDQVPILVLRHPGNLLTVYANISDITVKKGDKVTRGKPIAKVGGGEPSFLHFEVREGFESVDPAPFIKPS